jgi:hypothetical protein
MPELFADDIRGVQVPCSSCGATVELANTGLAAFDSAESVLCLECLVLGRTGSGAESEVVTPPLQERIALIDEVVADFSIRLRNVLVRSVKPDLSWNGDYGVEHWEHPSDALASAHAPGIWYGMRRRQLAARS